ncbi:hypothetical protein ACOQFO_09765 [Ureibacillus sp. MALMAid1270]
MNLLLSMFETYLLDEEHDINHEEQCSYDQQDFEMYHLDEFPVGFFTSL